MRIRPRVLWTAIALLAATRVQAATTLEREFTYDAGRVSVGQREGYTYVDAKQSTREFRTGRPDLPWISERVDLAPGTRVVGVEVIDVATETIAREARIAPALLPTPGLGPSERTRPDARFFGARVPQPEVLVSLGEQGSLRGRQVAYLAVSPVRWNPTTGVLERISRLRVRLTVDEDGEPPLRRERIVREWEDDGLASGIPTRELGAALASATPADGRGAVPFRPQQLPSVLGSPVAYVIVTSDALAPTFQQLADWKTQSGLPAVVRTVSFIRQEYPSAADDAERIRLFIRDAYTRWGTKWVLLGGDTDIIPTRLAHTTFYGGEDIATDLYFSCLDGNWNADGDSLYGEGFLDSNTPGDACDLLPEVYVGRASVLTPTEAQVFVNKTLQYEKTPAGGYEHMWMFFAEVLFPQPWSPGIITQLDGAELTEDLLPLTDQEPGIHLARLYENYTDARWRPGSTFESRALVLDSLSAGYNLALHVGHGYRNSMEVGDASLVNADALGLTNGNKLTNMYAINCTSTAIDFPCIGEAFMQNPNGGVVTNVGSTRFDFPSAGRAYQYEYFRLFIESGVTAVGELLARQKLPFVAFSNTDLVNRWTQMTLLMLGDPELRMWRGNWRTLTVAHPSSIALSDTSFAVNVSSGGVPVVNARVTAYRAGDDYRSVLTDALGNAQVPFRPDSVGSFTLTATATNARPYQATVGLTPSASATLVEGPVTIDDDNLGGTSGDANGLLDAGETVDLAVAVRNRGGATATGVVATLTTTDPQVSIVSGSAAYGSIVPGASAAPVAGFRLSVPYTMQDQREIPFKLEITDDSGDVAPETFQLTVRAPELRSYGHSEFETVGNGNGVPEPGETVRYTLLVRNNGTGVAHGVAATLRSYDGLCTITDSTSTFGDIAARATGVGDLLVFQPLAPGAQLTLILTDGFGVRTTQTLDLTYPTTPVGLHLFGAATSIAMVWNPSAASDLYGYNVYRSSGPSGPYSKVNAVPTDRIAYYTDVGLTSMVRYYYYVTAVDSSGNESGGSSVSTTSTNPPSHAIFPVPTGGTTPSNVALEYVYSAQQMDIAVGSDFLYVLHADGSAPVDADGQGATLGDFTNVGTYYAAGPSVAPLQPGQGWSIIGPTWNTQSLNVFDANGQMRPGFPFHAASPIWSSVACGDLDGDGSLEMVFGSNGQEIYALRANGTEWIDGDANPATQGVFKVTGSVYNYGTPALADLDGDGHPEIIYGSFDSKIYAWKANGTDVPGFPVVTNGSITASVAVGFLDGAGDTQPEIVVAGGNDSIYVLEPDGTRRPGWPVWMRTTGNSKTPSPVIADINGDGFNDVVFQSPNGGIYVYNRTGLTISGLTGLRYSIKTTGASESSPVVADINGDGRNDIIVGGEDGLISAFSGLNGQLMPGFPIQLHGEVRGAPAVADIDRDGKTEIVVAGWDKNIYVWDYDFPFQPSGVAPWPQFHHDARRTGFSGAPLFLGVDDGPESSAPVAQLEFAPPSPNPASFRSRLWFAVPSDLGGRTYELSIYDLTGRRVRQVDTGIARPGRFSLEWDLRDESRHPVEGGVYFARFTLGGRSVARKLIVLQ